MTIPIYDTATLPCITYPMNNTHEETKKYLGGDAITGAVKAEINIRAKNNAELNALYNFWLTSCNYGLEPFLISLPMFGMTAMPEAPDMLVKFKGHFSPNKESMTWKQSISLELIGTIDYIIDGNGDLIVSDAGEYTVTDSGSYVPTGNIINSYREVFYA